MKFDYCIGNPPYQLNRETTKDMPIYNAFMDAAYRVADKVELITPARFLFNAGATSKEWNKKMLDDEHFKVLKYFPNSTEVFPNVGFKGGVVISYHDLNSIYKPVETFSIHSEINSLRKKMDELNYVSISTIMYGQGSYKFSSLMHTEHPNIKYQEDENGNNIGILSKGHDKDIATNSLSKLNNIIMFDELPKDNKPYIRILGRRGNDRAYSYIQSNYVMEHPCLKSYKVFLPKANGSGALGEVLTTPLVGEPLVGATQTFITIGKFSTFAEAENCMKYIKTKFARALLGILKVTQDNPPEKWKYVPLQDFSSSSDIDWSKSIPEIDQQLYKKYNLTKEEIDFIESHVKEMN